MTARILSGLVCTGLASTAFAASVTPGADFVVDATVDTDGDNRWEDISGGGSGFDLELAGNVTRLTGVSSLPGIGAAYNFVGGAINNNSGALLSTAGTSTDRSFQNAPGDWTNNEDVTIEMWFKPDNLTPIPSNGQILFEDGGGTGLGLFVDGGQVVARKQPNAGAVAESINAIADEFIQAVATFDASAGLLELYVNGQFIGDATAAGNDWSGGDPAAVGTRGGANTGGLGNGQSSTESFDGQIAIFRVYRNQILTAQQVSDNFVAVTTPSPSAAFAGLMGLGGLCMRRRKNR